MIGTASRPDPDADRAHLIKAIGQVAGTRVVTKVRLHRSMNVPWSSMQRLLALLEAWGVISPQVEGTLVHDVLITAEEGRELIAELQAHEGSPHADAVPGPTPR